GVSAPRRAGVAAKGRDPVLARARSERTKKEPQRSSSCARLPYQRRDLHATRPLCCSRGADSFLPLWARRLVRRVRIHGAHAEPPATRLAPPRLHVPVDVSHLRPHRAAI